jgi:hypothetical protein
MRGRQAKPETHHPYHPLLAKEGIKGRFLAVIG